MEKRAVSYAACFTFLLQPFDYVSFLHGGGESRHLHFEWADTYRIGREQYKLLHRVIRLKTYK